MWAFARHAARRETLLVAINLSGSAVNMTLDLSAFAVTDGRSVVRDVLSGAWQAPLCERKDVPGDMLRLTLQLLQLDPDKRPRSLEEVRRRLVESLRRLAPSFGSSSASTILMRRCPELIGRAEQVHD